MTESAPARAPLPLWAAVLVAAASGPIMDAGFPDKGIWPLTLVGVGLVLVTLIGRGIGGSLLVGFVAGASFYFTHIFWASLFLGPLPMSALAVLESLFFAVGAGAITLAYRWVPRAWPSALGRLALLPVVIAGLWTAREAWASVWPYGGFAWGRVALSQSDSPLSPLFAWLGISGVSFMMVLVVAAAIEAVRGPDFLRALAIPVALATLLLVLPAWPVITEGSLRVAAVQGNSRAGYFDRREPGELLQAQLDATTPIFGQNVDVVLWPEGATDRSPLTDAYTASVLDYVSEQMDAPLVGWAVTERDGKFYNSELLWKAGEGATDFYDKKHPVPFGEYVPDRSFWEPFAPDLIGLIQREYTPGTTDMVFDIDGVIAGINICFDIIDDQLLTESVEQGAQVIFASSNNADFGRTDESAQQLAVARIRAIELGRSVVNISTVGISAVIAPDGSIVAQLPWYTAAAMIEDVPLSDAATPALLVGRQIEWLVSGIGLAALVIAGGFTRRRRA
ncbi:MAG: lnt [Rhodoglobus sp.]|nr:lnt [Rhodoglobus sp.]